MKVLVVLLSVSAVALASLEPAGYRPPGSSSQYIPPHHQSQHDHHQHQQSGYQYPQPSQYLPPVRQYQPQPSAPSSNYLPATEKPRIPKPVPANDYLPPTVPTTRPPPPAPPVNDYLPPLSRAQSTNLPVKAPVNDYLPPLSRAQSTNLPVKAPVNDYLPPLSRAQSTNLPVKAPASDYLPAKKPVPAPSAPANDYLPPQASKPALKTVLPPKTEYLPAARVSAPSAPKSDYLPPTTTPRIPVINAYAKQPTKFATAASSSPARNSGYEYQQQPTDNYLPPNTAAGEFRSAAATAPAPAAAYAAPVAAEQSGYQYEASSQDDGYHYDAAATQGGYHYGVEQTTEPAKYDFEYRVSDEFGNDFSHKETREGAATRGSYAVLLPDGRKQIIQYDADENGFQPRITYEAVATVLGPKAALDGYEANASNLGGY